MAGTNFRSGVATRQQYNGSTAAADRSRLNAQTKLIRRCAVIRINDPQDSETETGFTFPDNVIVHDVHLNVITEDATETVDVGTMGTSNDPNGFLAAASLANAGLVKGSMADGAVTRGELLREITATATAALARSPCITCGGDPVSYTCSSGTDTAEFDIVIDYDEVVTEAQ